MQDALVAVRDCAYFKGERQFILLLNRFRWEADPGVDALGFFRGRFVTLTSGEPES